MLMYCTQQLCIYVNCLSFVQILWTCKLWSTWHNCLNFIFNCTMGHVACNTNKLIWFGNSQNFVIILSDNEKLQCTLIFCLVMSTIYLMSTLRLTQNIWKKFRAPFYSMLSHIIWMFLTKILKLYLLGKKGDRYFLLGCASHIAKSRYFWYSNLTNIIFRNLSRSPKSL